MFSFAERNSFSIQPIEKVAEYLRSTNEYKGVTVVQNDPEHFHLGDVRCELTDASMLYYEIKAESRTSLQTPNLAIERYSSVQARTDGGPWQTKAILYAHIYSDGLLCIMDRLELKNWLNKNMSKYKSFSAENVGYTTTGVLIPRLEAASFLSSYREQQIY